MMRIEAAIAMLLMCLSGACDQSTPASPVKLPPPTFGPGILRGTVTLAGPRPAVQKIHNMPCCADSPEFINDETVVVDDHGRLANVVVFLTGISASDGSSATPALLDQKFCQYKPHVVALQAGQKLTVRSSDATIHNVHYAPQHNPARNLTMQSAGDQTSVTFNNPEFIRLKCDVHPWMTAYVAVLENPFFGTTREDGSYEISKIPPGAYALTAWHERYGTVQQQITVAASGATITNFEYKAE